MKTSTIVSKFLVAIALTFIIPQMVFVYVWEDLSARLSYILLSSSVLLVAIGLYLIWDIIQSVRSIFKNIEGITTDELKVETAQAGDEIHLVGNSIEVISKKIAENMQELQRSAVTIEETKKELNQALLYIENVMNSMGDALIVVDPNFRVQRVNRAAEELFKYTEEEILNHPIGRLFDKISQDLFSEDAVVKGKRMTAVTRENEKVPVDANIRPLLDPKGSLLGSVLVARDMRVTLALIARLEHMNTSLEKAARKRTDVIDKISGELKIKDAQILQQEKMASIGILAAGIAHEINNPIGYINSNMEVLREDIQDIFDYTQKLENSLTRLAQEDHQDDRDKAVEEMRQVRSGLKMNSLFQDSGDIIKESKEGLDRIKRIIIDLKKFSHADDNKMVLADLNQEIESTLNIAANELKYKAQVVKEFGDLPQIECFSHQLNQVFMNILVNAAQAIKEKGNITIRTYVKGDSIYVIIKDTGTGISPENVNKIFDPFFTTKEVGKGTGLGLYIGYGIIEKHQGKISVESEVGKGTSFTIQLPVHPVWSHVETEEAGVPVPD